MVTPVNGSRYVPDPRQYIEYLLVSDKNSKVLAHTLNYIDAKRAASLIRKAGGEVSIFKMTKG